MNNIPRDAEKPFDKSSACACGVHFQDLVEGNCIKPTKQHL